MESQQSTAIAASGKEHHDTSAKQSVIDRRYLRMAEIWAENSYCQRRKVGAIIVKNSMIISDGFNGTPSGFENVCEDQAGIIMPKPTPLQKLRAATIHRMARLSTSRHRHAWNAPN